MTTDTEKLRKTLSINIKKYRITERLSQEKLAEKSNVSVQLIKDIEGCRSWVSDKTIVKLAQVLKVEAYQLLFPQTEGDRLHTIRMPADVLSELQTTIKNSIDSHFAALVKKD